MKAERGRTWIWPASQVNCASGKLRFSGCTMSIRHGCMFTALQLNKNIASQYQCAHHNRGHVPKQNGGSGCDRNVSSKKWHCNFVNLVTAMRPQMSVVVADISIHSQWPVLVPWVLYQQVLLELNSLKACTTSSFVWCGCSGLNLATALHFAPGCARPCRLRVEVRKPI